MISINYIKEFPKKHYYAILCFAFVMIYSCIIPGEFNTSGVDSAVMAIHAVDFGMGFCSRLLPGAIYNLFFDSVSTVKTSIYLATLLVIFFAIISLLLEKFILKIKTEQRKIALIILAFFLTGPSTFAIHTYYPGMLDMYWVFCALLFFIFLSSKHLKFLIFLPFVLCITIYFSSIICFIPFFVIILLYEITYSKTKKEKLLLWSVLIISSIAALGLTVYFAICEGDNLIYTIEEFHEIYSKKGIDDFFYFDQSLYKDVTIYNLDEFAVFEQKSYSTLEKILWEFTLRVNYNLQAISIKDKLVVFALISPLVFLIFGFIFNRMRFNWKNRYKLRLFSNICTVSLPFFTILSSVFFSEDLIRWIGHAFLTLFVSFLFMLYKEKEIAFNWIEKQISKIPFVLIIFYFGFYATTIYHPYYSG